MNDDMLSIFVDSDAFVELIKKTTAIIRGQNKFLMHYKTKKLPFIPQIMYLQGV